MNITKVPDLYNGYPVTRDEPSDNYAAVTPSDSTPLPWLSRGLFVGGAGDVVVVRRDGEQVTFTGVAAGTWLPIRVAGVMATGTTATSIVQL